MRLQAEHHHSGPFDHPALRPCIGQLAANFAPLTNAADISSGARTALKTAGIGCRSPSPAWITWRPARTNPTITLDAFRPSRSALNSIASFNSKGIRTDIGFVSLMYDIV